MPSIYSGNPANVTAILADVASTADNGSGAVRVQTTAAHNFATNDKVWFSGTTGIPTLEPFSITVIDATHYDLVGVGFTTTDTSGVCFDLSLTPAVSIPSNGEAPNADVLAATFQAILDRTQALQLRQYLRLMAAFLTSIAPTGWGTIVDYVTTIGATPGPVAIGTLFGLQIGDVVEFSGSLEIGLPELSVGNMASVRLEVSQAGDTTTTAVPGGSTQRTVNDSVVNDVYTVPFSGLFTVTTAGNVVVYANGNVADSGTPAGAFTAHINVQIGYKIWRLGYK